MNPLDDPARYSDIRDLLQRKRALRLYYCEVYEKFAACAARTPPRGRVLEIGSGAGFAIEHVAGLITSDVLYYPRIDLVLDARRLPFRAGSLRAILMFNVFHHIPDVGAFLTEAARTLIRGGRVLIVDEHPGVIGTPIYRYLHHEPFDPHGGWTFESRGPLSSANGALCWIVFQRDRSRFEREHPELRLDRYQPHTPLRYWLAGGLRRWSVLPVPAFPAATAVDRWLTLMAPQTGCFVDVELVRQ